MSNSLQPHGLQHARLPCLSTPRACSNSSPLSQWCHPTISSFLISFFHLQSLLACQGLFQWVSSSHQVVKVLKLISPSNEYSGLISFRTDWFELLAVQGTQESSLAPQFESTNSSVLSLLYSPTLTSVHGEKHSFDYMDLCWQSVISAF